MKALIIDDSTIAYGNIAIMVERLGIEVVGNATTENEIEKTIRHHRPELILIDTRGSYLHGTDTVRRIKKNYPETNVIAVSVFENRHSVKQIFTSGISDIITKPVESERLMESLKRLGILTEQLSSVEIPASETPDEASTASDHMNESEPHEAELLAEMEQSDAAEENMQATIETKNSPSDESTGTVQEDQLEPQTN